RLELAARDLLERVAVPLGVDEVAGEHGVEADARERGAAPAEEQELALEVVDRERDRRIREDGPEALEDARHRELRRRAGVEVAGRHVRAPAILPRERDPGDRRS